MNTTRKNVDFSIIIPAHNSEKTLRRAVESVVINNDSGYEIIIVENGSKDNTLQLAHELADEYITVKVIQSEQGVSKARNTGIKEAIGNMVVFLDSDDFLYENSCQVFHDDLIEKYDLWLYGHFAGTKQRSVVDGKEGVSYLGDDEVAQATINFLKNPTRYMQVWAKMFKRSIITDNNIFFNEELSMAEDSDFTLRYLNYCHNIYLSAKNIYCYSVDAVSAVRLYDGTKLSKYVLSMNETRKIIDSSNQELVNAYNYYVLMHMNIVMVREVFTLQNKENIRHKYEDMKQVFGEKTFNAAMNAVSLKDCTNIKLAPIMLAKLHLPCFSAFVYIVKAYINADREKKNEKNIGFWDNGESRWR